MAKQLTQAEIIIRFNNRNKDNEYDYSLVEYINSYTKVKIICNKHNKIFMQIPIMHINGQGCPICRKEKDIIRMNFYSKLKNIKAKNEFEIKANVKHTGKYTYEKFVYINSTSRSIITCPIDGHGEFIQRASAHLDGEGCPDCSIGRIAQTKEDNSAETIKRWELKIIEASKKRHNNKYTYEKFVYINSTLKCIVTCPKHGDFKIITSEHLRGVGCSKCNGSKGEARIEEFLRKNNIKFEPQCKYFQESTNKYCINPKTNRKLRFDFYLPDFNHCIEFDGVFHYSLEFLNNMKIFPEKFHTNSHYEDEKFKDEYKNKFCEDNNINILRIPFWEYRNIEDILKNILKITTI